MKEPKKKHDWVKVSACREERPALQVYNSCEELTPIPISFPSKGSIGETGDWRTFRPVIDQEKCTNCGMCWIYCPEGVIQPDAEGQLQIDYVYCKGCGICAKQCKPQGLTMVRETEAKEAGKKSEIEPLTEV
ncbi:MAG TPA: 4Fe-4S binding protein [Candidatus Lokiarchaeia archaeon]|nr:4Fe-4S binding protein [Candidatus Lokiarchaeia archaeon]